MFSFLSIDNKYLLFHMLRITATFSIQIQVLRDGTAEYVL